VTVAATPAQATAGEVLACRECGTVHRLPAMPDDTVARCVACGAKLYTRFEATVERTLALYLAALALFLVANAFPILSLAIAGQTNASTILDSAKALHDDGMWPLALAVGLAGCVIALAKILGMLAVLSGGGTSLGSGALRDRGVRLALRRLCSPVPGRRSGLGLMLAIHPDARTTLAVRAEIARSSEPTGELARRYGISTETVRKWRQRGPAECRDRSSRPHRLPWKASEEERAVVCELRGATGFPLDDLAFVVNPFLPRLDRDNVHRILKAAGLSRRPAAATKAAGTFQEYELGFVHLDVKHLPKLRTASGEWRKRLLFVAIDRRSRFVRLAVRDDETEASARAFLEEALAAFPFRVTHVLTDSGSCFTAEGFGKACREFGVAHRETRPYTPRTNGMAERFNGRVQRRCSGSPSPATATWSGCWRASTRPTTPAGSACWTGLTRRDRPRAPGAGSEPRQPRL
jgi:transposase InsO family protein